MTWASGHDAGLQLDGLDADAERQLDEILATARSVAALALFKAGGDQARLREFESLTTLDQGVDSELSCQRYGRCQAAWTYLSLAPDVTDPELRSLIEDSVVATADRILAGADTTSYGFSLEHPEDPGRLPRPGRGIRGRSRCIQSGGGYLCR
jgi:hypothetical protein